MSDTAAALAALNQTLRQTNEALQRTNDYIQECMDLVDELFPEAEDERKPPAEHIEHRYYSMERGT